MLFMLSIRTQSDAACYTCCNAMHMPYHVILVTTSPVDKTLHHPVPFQFSVTTFDVSLAQRPAAVCSSCI